VVCTEAWPELLNLFKLAAASPAQLAQQDRQSFGVELVGLVGKAHAPLGL
jgi:hypothetical protein